MVSRSLHGLRYIAGLAIACAAAVVFSYSAVRFAARAGRGDAPKDDVLLEQATELRRSSNELVRLMNGYFARLQGEREALSADFLAWVKGTFRPGLNGLRGDMMTETLPSEVSGPLAQAADVAAALAGSPGDASLRRRAAEAVLGATEKAERWIAGTRSARHLSTPRVLPDAWH